MLSQLSIQNFAIIDKLDISFNSGMSVITGETGAGKSIAIDALGLALGDRADASMVKHGANRSDITAVFDVSHNYPALQWLTDHELDEDNQCILRRTIAIEGGSKAYINGRPATLQQLKELGELMIDIHSQHQHQSLMRPDTQRMLLDNYGQCNDMVKTVKSAFKNWYNLEQQLQSIKSAMHDRDSRIDFLQFVIKELVDLELKPNEWTSLEAEHKQLANAEKIQSNLSRCLDTLYQGDVTVSSQLETVNLRLSEVADYIPAIKNSIELLNSALINIDEAVNELRHLLNDDAINPQQLLRIESRMSTLLDAARKHHCKPDELQTLLHGFENELMPLVNAEDCIEQLEKQITESKSVYDQEAKKLSSKRAAAAIKLESACIEILNSLGMKNCRLKVELENISDNKGSQFGNEKINYLVQTNPGSPFKPLIKIASGGELSRISLSIQVVTAKMNTVPVLVFDEVDVGIGGGTAEVVGRLLRQLSSDKQVICITHQAQVAAQGHYHWVVEKQISAEETVTKMVLVTKDKRETEIARMIGGIKLTAATQKHAKEMLTNASLMDG